MVFSDKGQQSFTRTSEQRSVPRIVVPESLTREALNRTIIASAAAHPGRCYHPLAEMSDSDINDLMLEAVKHRMQQKSNRISKVVDALGEDEWLWQAMAETLGYRPNKLAMTLLSQRLPIYLLKSNLIEAESIIFGAAGFLSAENHDQAQGDTRQYLRNLWETWWSVRANYEPDEERCIPWKLSGIRPINHPQRRLAILAQIVLGWDEFTDSCQTMNSVSEFMQNQKHDYWNHHYTLSSKRSEKSLALMGNDRLRDFQINHLLPAKLMKGDNSMWEFFLKAPAPALSEKVEKASIRLFGNSERRPVYQKKYWQHQALLQIYQDFCLKDATDCLECPFPEQLSQWNKKTNNFSI